MGVKGQTPLPYEAAIFSGGVSKHVLCAVEGGYFGA
jgi:hypothetical protein